MDHHQHRLWPLRMFVGRWITQWAAVVTDPFLPSWAQQWCDRSASCCLPWAQLWTFGWSLAAGYANKQATSSISQFEPWAVHWTKCVNNFSDPTNHKQAGTGNQPVIASAPVGWTLLAQCATVGRSNMLGDHGLSVMIEMVNDINLTAKKGQSPGSQ